jgi:adenylate kinase
LIVSVTGTPAVGKSSFAKKLSEALPNSKMIEINDVVEEHKLFSRIDEIGSKVVKMKELESEIQTLIEKEEKKSNLILVGHLIPDLNLKQDLVVVLRLNLNTLIERLEARDYPKEKVKENLVSESVDYCGVKAKEKCPQTYEIETDAEKEEMIDYIVSIPSGSPKKAPEMKEISKFDELLELVTSDNKYGL